MVLPEGGWRGRCSDSDPVACISFSSVFFPLEISRFLVLSVLLVQKLKQSLVLVE